VAGRPSCTARTVRQHHHRRRAARTDGAARARIIGILHRRRRAGRGRDVSVTAAGTGRVATAGAATVASPGGSSCGRHMRKEDNCDTSLAMLVERLLLSSLATALDTVG